MTSCYQIPAVTSANSAYVQPCLQVIQRFRSIMALQAVCRVPVKAHTKLDNAENETLEDLTNVSAILNDHCNLQIPRVNVSVTAYVVFLRRDRLR